MGTGNNRIGRTSRGILYASQEREEHFLRGGGVFIGTVRHLSPGDQEQFTVEAIGAEAVTTSEIGEARYSTAPVCNRSIRRQLV